MSTIIKYKGQTIAEVTDGSKILSTSGKVTESNIEVACTGTTATVKKSTSTLVSVADGETKTLNCAARFLDGDITVESASVEPSTVTIPSGTYVASTAYLYASSVGDYSLNFISNSNSYSQMRFVQNIDGIDVYYDNTKVCYTNVEGDRYWTNNNYKTVKLETDQTVSAEFGTWFNSNFTKQPDTVTIEAGTYVANTDIDTSLQFTDIELSFTSNNTNYAYMTVGIYADPFFTELVYIKDNHNANIAYNANTQWTNTAYKTITISTPQSVSPEFREWFNSNFEKEADGYQVIFSGYAEDANAQIEINGEHYATTTDFGDFTYTIENVKTFRIYTASGDGITVNSGTGSLANYTITNDSSKPNNGATVDITEDSTLDVNVLD